MNTSLSSITRPPRPAAPHEMWRELCWVTEQLAVSGDLSMRPDEAREQLARWEEAGITDVFDMRGECDDSDFIHAESNIRSHWYGVDDNGGKRSDAWFISLTEKCAEVLADPGRKVLVHCHMGVNRGPSALYAVMLVLGWNHLDALRAIRNARPIAGIIYAADAARWHATQQGMSADEVVAIGDDVDQWLDRNYLDLAYVIRSIGNRLAL
jgi:dual specificity phosphatase 3